MPLETAVIHLLVAVVTARPRSGVAVTLCADWPTGAAPELHADALFETMEALDLYATGVASGLEALAVRSQVHVVVPPYVSDAWGSRWFGVSPALVDRLGRAITRREDPLDGGPHALYFAPMARPREEPPVRWGPEHPYFRTWQRAQSLVSR